MGVALDKIAKFEDWTGDGDSEDERQDRLAKILDRLTRSRNTVTLAVRPRDPAATAIDVTPCGDR